MGLIKRTESSVVYLEVKHYSLWRALKKEVAGCDVVEVNNPATGAKVTKYGYKFDTVTGLATMLVKYDTGQKYAKRYFGFKLSLMDGGELFVLDMPYSSQILRRLVHVAPNIDWSRPLSITVFAGKKKEGAKAGADPTGIWFQQDGETVKVYYTRDNAHGMPDAVYDDERQEWDFRAQQRWLVERLKNDTIPAIEAAAKAHVKSLAKVDDDNFEPPAAAVGEDPNWEASDDDVPF
jgi:hypothetical protein